MLLAGHKSRCEESGLKDIPGRESQTPTFMMELEGASVASGGGGLVCVCMCDDDAAPFFHLLNDRFLSDVLSPRLGALLLHALYTPIMYRRKRRLACPIARQPEEKIKEPLIFLSRDEAFSYFCRLE